MSVADASSSCDPLTPAALIHEIERPREADLGVVSRFEVGAPDGTRTHDHQVRNLALYPLSYGRALDFTEDWRRGRDLNPRRL